MTPAELKQMALDASKKEYETVVSELKKSAQEGRFAAEFKSLTEGTRELLRAEGYSVAEKSHSRYIAGTHQTINYWEVRFGS